MRATSLWLYALAALVALAGLGFNLYMQSLACAFGTAAGRCRFHWPWQMSPEDLAILVLAPSAAVLILVALGWRAGRR